MDASDLVNCKNCGNPFKGNYCNNCGQKLIRNRFTLRIVLKDINQEIFNLDKGFFYTIKELIINPGKVIKEYLNGRTKAYYNPIKFLVIIAGLAALFAITTNSFDNNLNTTNHFTQGLTGQSTTVASARIIKLQTLIKNYLNILMILVVPFYSLGFKIFFPKEKLNYTEHFIINCYAFSLGNLLTILISLSFLFFPTYQFFDQIFSFVLIIAIYCFFYYKILKIRLIIVALKSILSIIIGLLIFTFCFTTLLLFIVKLTSYFHN